VVITSQNPTEQLREGVIETRDAVEQADEIFMALSAFSKAAGDKQVVEKRTDFKYQEVPLRDVVAEIAFRYKIPFVVDALVPETKSMATPITCSLEGVILPEALNEMMNPFGLTCHYKYEVLFITAYDSDLITEDHRVHVEPGTPLAKTLDAKAELQYLAVPLNDVLSDLSERYRVRIVNESDLNMLVATAVNDVSLRSALALLLREKGLYADDEEGSLVIRKSKVKI
jgi:hypothetical protein